MKDANGQSWDDLNAQGLDPCVHCLESTIFGNGRFVNRIPADTGDHDGYACAECMAIECDHCGETLPLDDDFHHPETGEGFYHDDCLKALGFTEKQIEEGQE